jgi:hypothetical protein
MEGSWLEDGPLLPIELCRVADGGELSTAICVDAVPVQVLWAVLDVSSIQEGCDALKEREQIPSERNDGIGTLSIAASGGGHLTRWAQEREIGAVIWTALPPRFEGIEGRIPNSADAVEYLLELEGGIREHAQSYIQQLPPQVSTPYRLAIKQSLGWG